MARQNVDFVEVSNPMIRFLLDDGTELSIKCVLMRVTRCDEKLPDGQYKHEFQIQTLVDQIAPEGQIDIKKLASGGGSK